LRGSIEDALLKSKKFRLFGLNADDIIKHFFAGNATIAIVVLALITVFLFREGIEFFPKHYESLRLYRWAGMEFVDYLKHESTDLSALNRMTNLMKRQESEVLRMKGLSQAQIAERLAPLDAFAAKFSEVPDGLNGLVADLTEIPVGILDRHKMCVNAQSHKTLLIRMGKIAEANAVKVDVIDFGKETAILKTFLPQCTEIHAKIKQDIVGLMSAIPDFESAEARATSLLFKKLALKFTDGIPVTEKKMAEWNPGEPIHFYRALTDFIFGSRWVTQSFWYDFYGVVPLFVGSFMISLLAMILAVPFGVGAAIYVNQMASKCEQNMIKPYIEFISAIPSVVLGFFGIAILGESVRWLTQQSCLSWVPFFPISERLNIFTAGCLLALMAVPTIFSLAEDAINNVPKAYKEASLALGANKLQTVVRIIVPTALSGIVAAVLLGFGRVIGETMVVLLVAGNRISIPDFTAGIGVFFQPAHTMTGLIAQEMGEVVRGSLQYRALFMVGILLFFISLFINYMAQKIVTKYRISAG